MKNKKYFKWVVVFLLSILFLNGISPLAQKAEAASVKLNRKSATLWVGETLQLKLKNAKKKVKWVSDKKSVATVNAKGKVKAKKPGKAVITAKTGKKQYKCKITVKKTSLSAKQITLTYGSSKSLTLKDPKKKVSWFSSNKKVAVADGRKVYAKSVGEAVITAKCNGKSYSCKVNVVSGETEELTENGSYTSKEKVALYIHTYHKLPGNYMTKEQARALGWEGGLLSDYAVGKCIGGDVYSNYERTLPVKEGRIYYECDINTLGALQRGAERLVYSNDGLIYYTADHYATFEKLYE